MSEYPSCWVACWPTRNPFSKERHLQLLMGFLFNANSLSASPGMFPSVPFQGRSAAGLLPQGGSSLLLVPSRRVSGQCALPPLLSSASYIYLLGCFTLLSRSHLTTGRGLCFVPGCPTGTEDGHNSSKAPGSCFNQQPSPEHQAATRGPPQVWRVAPQAKLLLQTKFTEPFHFWELGLVWGGFIFSTRLFQFCP